MNYLDHATNPMVGNKISTKEMMRQLFNPTPEENAEWAKKKAEHDKRRRAAIAKLEAEGYYK